MSEDGKLKYYRLKEELREQILSGKIKAGDKLPSENELARTYCLSRHTVRKALAILADAGYVEAVHGSGTYCLKRFGKKRESKIIAVVTTYLSNYIFPKLIQGIDKVLSENGYSIILKNTGNSRKKEAEYLEDLLTKDIDGMIIEPSKSELYCKHVYLYERMEENQIPYVFIQGLYEQMEEKPHILMDDCQGGYLVTNHLIRLGHRHIVGIFKADDRQGRERHRGYVKALQEAGFLYEPDQVIWFHTEDRREKPSAALRQLRKQGREIDGIVCYNDEIAIQVMESLKQEGLSVPEDLSVTGYDDSLYARESEVGITTIAHPQEKLGEMAAQLLLEQLRHVPPEASRVQRLIEAKLIVRDSCRDRKKQLV